MTKQDKIEVMSAIRTELERIAERSRQLPSEPQDAEAQKGLDDVYRHIVAAIEASSDYELAIHLQP